MRKTRRIIGRNAEFYVIDITLGAFQPTDFHTREELTANSVKTSGRYSAMTSPK
jgi:hypothetical protein